MEKHTLDAKNMSIGRVASQAAHLLMGKNIPAYRRNIGGTAQVEIVNASKVKMTEKKMEQKEYAAYSGYPGGLKMLKMTDVVAKKGFTEVFRRAVGGMLPHNKLKKEMMKHLTITE